MSNTSLSDTSLSMKVVLAGIRARFFDVVQMSTDEYFKFWSSNSISENSSSESAVHQNNFITFDVRGEEERDISCIKSSIWIDSSKDTKTKLDSAMQVISNKIDELKSLELKGGTNIKKQITVVAYCSIGYRSSELINQIQKSDLIKCAPSNITLNFYNLEGSLFKWANENKPLVDSNSLETCFVHPYNNIWGKLLNEEFRKWSKA